MKHILLLKAGEAAAPIRLAAGDYDAWFARALGREGLRFTVVRTSLGERPPRRAREFDAVMMTGSPLSATLPSEWMRRAANYLVEAGEQQVPVLGVCFGLQLLALGLGGQVVRNPRGREIGTVEVQLSPEGRRDPLFQGLPRSVAVQTTHEDIVPSAPEGSTVLASNACCEVQALRVGRYLRAVQFHPELDAAAMGAVVSARAGALANEAEARGERGTDAVPTLFAGLRHTPAGPLILRNFIRHWT